MTKTRSLPPLLLLCAIVSPALAAPASSARASGETRTPWTQEEYVRTALGLSPDARSAQDTLEAASAKARARWARAFAPSLSFSAKLSPAKLAPASRFTFDSWRGEANDLLLTPGLSWNLFNSFQDLLSARSGELSREGAREGLAAARQAEAFDALQAYWALYLREKLLEVGRQNIQVQREQYDLTLDRYKHGMKSLSDLLKTETDWRSAELRFESDEAQSRLALFQFNILVGTGEDAPAALQADLAIGTTVPPRLEDGLRAAMENKPEMRRNRLEVAQAEISHRLARIGAGPTVSLDFDASHSWSGAYGAAALPFGARSAVYGFALRLALPSSFNLYSQIQDVRASAAELRKTMEGAEALRRQVRGEVYQSHIQLTRALRSLEISERKEDISRQNLELVKEEYSQGSADVIRLSQAQSDYVGAQAERLQAIHDAKINWARWQRATGEPLWR